MTKTVPTAAAAIPPEHWLPVGAQPCESEGGWRPEARPVGQKRYVRRLRVQVSVPEKIFTLEISG